MPAILFSDVYTFHTNRKRKFSLSPSLGRLQLVLRDKIGLYTSKLYLTVKEILHDFLGSMDKATFYAFIYNVLLPIETDTWCFTE